MNYVILKLLGGKNVHWITIKKADEIFSKVFKFEILFSIEYSVCVTEEIWVHLGPYSIEVEFANHEGFICLCILFCFNEPTTGNRPRNINDKCDEYKFKQGNIGKYL